MLQLLSVEQQWAKTLLCEAHNNSPQTWNANDTDSYITESTKVNLVSFFIIC